MLRSRFSVQLKQHFPQEVWSWLFIALRHDALIWENLEETGLGEQALETFPERPEMWTPGNLAFFAITGSLPSAPLNELPMKSLDEGLDRQAVQVGWEWEHEKLSVFDLKQAGLLALYWREQWCTHNSWDGMRAAFTDHKHPSWTVLACLYSLIPDPVVMLQDLLRTSNAKPPFSQVLHAVFCNPMPADMQAITLLALTEHLNLSQALEILREVNLYRPWLSQKLSREFLARQPLEIPIVRMDDSPERQCEKIRDVLQFAELDMLSGQPGQALKGINGSIQATRQLQSNLSARYAKTASVVSEISQNPSNDQQFKSVIVNAWKHAARLAPELAAHTVGLVKALLSAGQSEQAQEIMQHLPEGSNPRLAPDLLITMASLEDHFGDKTRALQIAQEALSSIESGASVELEDALILTRLLKKLAPAELVIRTARAALMNHPSHPELLQLSAQSHLLQDQPDQALENIYSILAAGEASSAGQNWSDRRDVLQQMVIESLEQMGDWDAALSERTDLVMRSGSTSSQDFHSLAHCALRAGQPERAGEACNKALQLNENDDMAYQLLGETSLALGDLQEAIQRFQKTVHLAPNRPGGWLTLAKTYRLAGEHGHMLQTLRSGSLALPEAPEIHLALGEAYLDQDAPTQALPSLRRAANLAVSPHIALRLGQTLLKLGHLDEARQVLERAMSVVPPEKLSTPAHSPEKMLNEQEAELHLVYARTLQAQNELSRAIPIYEKVVQAFPEQLEPRFDLAKALINSSEEMDATERATVLLQNIIRENSVSGDSLPLQQAIMNESRLLLAEIYAKKGDYAESMLCYRKVLDNALSNRPGEHTRLALGFGRVALALNEPEPALALLQEASRTDPRNPQVLQLLCEAYQANGLVEEAFEVARELLDLTPSDLENLIWFIEQATHIQAMPGGGKLPIRVEVTRALDYATRLAPSRADLLMRLGKVLQENGDRFAAAETYRRLASLAGAEIHISLKDLVSVAEALREIGDAQLSVTLFQRVLSQVHSGASQELLQGLGSTAEVLGELSLSQQKAGDFQGALKSLDLALDLEINNANLHLKKADLLEKMGHCEAALESLQAAIFINPENATAQFHIASLFRELGNLPEASCHAEQTVRIACQFGPADLLHTGRLFAAELAYNLLKSQQAWAHIHADLAGDETCCEHLPHTCLRAEMALDAREINLAREELDRLNSASHQDRPFLSARILANQSRLALLNREPEKAIQQFSSAMQVLESVSQKEEAAVSGIEKSDRIACLRAVSRSALELGKWDTAVNISRRLAFLAPEEPSSHLQLVQVIVKRAEAQLLCQDLEVKKNGVGISALSDEARRSFDAAIESAILQSGCQVENQEISKHPPGESLIPPLITLWYARGLAAFEPNQSSAFMLGNELRELAAKPDELAALLLVLRRVGETASALKAVDNFQKKDPGGYGLASDPAVRVQMALALEEAEPLKAIQIVQDALLEMSEDNPLVWPASPMFNFLTARLAVRSGALDVAQASIQDALIAWSNEASWHAQAARIFLTEDADSDLPDIPQAVKHLEESIRFDPENPWSYKVLGQIYMDCEEYSRADQVLEQVVRLSPQDAQAWLALAKAQLKTGILDAAASSTEHAIENDRDLTEAVLLRAEIALRAKNPRGALSRLQETLEIDPLNPHALHLLALSLEALDRNEEALKAIEKAIPLVENPVHLEIEKIKLVRKIHGFDAGLSSLQENIQQHPQSIEMVVLLSDWLFEAGNHQSAVQVAQALLQINRHNLTPRQISELHFRIGFQMRRTGQLDQALHHLNKSIEHAPDYLEAYLELGRAYQDQRASHQALKVYQTAITVSPNDYRPYYLAGQAMKEGKDFPNAEAMLRKAAQLAPDEVSVHRLLGAVVVLNLVHSRRTTSNETKNP